MSNNGTIVPGLHSTDSNLPPEVVNKLEGTGSNQVIFFLFIYFCLIDFFF